MSYQEAEKVRQDRSRIVQTLNGDPAASPLGGAHKHGAPYRRTVRPRGYASGFDSSAALLDGLFELPARVLVLSFMRGH